MLFAYLLPGLSLLFNKRPWLGALLLVLQPTLLGWGLAIPVAVRNLKRQRRRRRHHGPDRLPHRAASAGARLLG